MTYTADCQFVTDQPKGQASHCPGIPGICVIIIKSKILRT